MVSLDETCSCSVLDQHRSHIDGLAAQVRISPLLRVLGCVTLNERRNLGRKVRLETNMHARFLRANFFLHSLGGIPFSIANLRSYIIVSGCAPRGTITDFQLALTSPVVPLLAGLPIVPMLCKNEARVIDSPAAAAV